MVATAYRAPPESGRRELHRSARRWLAIGHPTFLRFRQHRAPPGAEPRGCLLLPHPLISNTSAFRRKPILISWCPGGAPHPPLLPRACADAAMCSLVAAHRTKDQAVRFREGGSSHREGGSSHREGAAIEREEPSREREGAATEREGAATGREGAAIEREGAGIEKERGGAAIERVALVRHREARSSHREWSWSHTHFVVLLHKHGRRSMRCRLLA